MEEKSNLYIVAIVGIVAIVALIILVVGTGREKTELPIEYMDDATGEVYLVSPPDDGSGGGTSFFIGCRDSDPANDPYKYGVVTASGYSKTGTVLNFPDKCVKERTYVTKCSPPTCWLEEYWCYNGTKVIGRGIECRYGCANGACKPRPY